MCDTKTAMLNVAHALGLWSVVGTTASATVGAIHSALQHRCTQGCQLNRVVDPTGEVGQSVARVPAVQVLVAAVDLNS